MLPGYAAVALLTITLTGAAPQTVPQLINVGPPQPYRAPSAPNNTAVYPLGNSTCDDAVRGLMDMATLCLNSYSADSDNQQWCQDDNGCRKVLAGLARELFPPCYLQDRLHPTIANVFDQIAYASLLACPPDDDGSCDVQTDLALAMIEFPANLSLLCSPCVKKSFGARSINSSHAHLSENIGKARCNQVEGQYCDLRGRRPTSADACDPCWQRYYAKFHAANARHDVDDGFDRRLRACYDNGHGDSCYNHSMSLLTSSYNMIFDSDGIATTFGDLEVCRQDDACGQAACRSVLESVIQNAGCCASALPILLLGGLRLPCLEPVIDSMVGLDTACFDPFTYFVDVTVATTDSVENVCRAVSEDTATTLGMLPELISCKKSNRNDDEGPDIVAVKVDVKRYRAVGTPMRAAFDPDLLQYPVVKVLSYAVL